MTTLTEDEAWANYDRLVKDGATGQYLDETRAAIRAALRDTPVADTAGVDAAWREAVDLIPEGVERAISIGQYPPDHESAGDWVALVVYAPHFYGDGSTVAAALLALAAALRTPKPEGEPE